MVTVTVTVMVMVTGDEATRSSVICLIGGRMPSHSWPFISIDIVVMPRAFCVKWGARYRIAPRSREYDLRLGRR